MRSLCNVIYLCLCLYLMVFPGFAVDLLSESTPAVHPSTTATGKIVARVNGKPIYKEQLNPEVERGLAKFRRYGMRQEDPNLVKKLQKKALDRLIGNELIYQESQKLVIEDVDARVEQKLKSLEKKYG